jgi:hypothetical protein
MATALQLHYTSCRAGRSGGHGFQVRTASDGLRPDDERGVVGVGGYHTPSDRPPQPTEEEVATLFPRAFQTAVLDSGHLAIISTSYSGKDYTGRYGNFFLHALVLPDDLVDRWPIDLADWDGWVAGLDPDEDTSASPPPLPSLDLDEADASESFTFDELSEFLQEEEGRTTAIEAMIRAVLLREETSRKLVIRDSDVNGIYWVAAVQKAFPIACQRDLPSTTYHHDPNTCPALTATTGQTRFLFNDRERRFQLFVFDFEEGQHSEVPALPGPYARRIAAWMADQPEQLEQFHRFAAMFRVGGIGTELNHLVRLFDVGAGKRVEVADLVAALAFARERAFPEAREALLEAVVGATKGLRGVRDPVAWVEVVRFLAQGAAASRQDEHVEAACAAWTSMLDDLVLEHGVGLAELEALEGTIGKLGGERWAASLLGEHPRLDLDRLTAAPPEVQDYLLQLFLRAGKRTACSAPWELDAVESVVVAIGSARGQRSAAARRAMAPFRNSEAGLRAVLELMVERISTAADTTRTTPRLQALGKGLGQVLREAPAQIADAIRRGLDHSGSSEGVSLLEGDYAALLERADDPVAALDVWRRTVQPVVPRFAAARHGAMSVKALAGLPGQGRVAVAVRWLRGGLLAGFDDESAEIVLGLAASKLPLESGDPESDSLARMIEQLRDSRDLGLKPDVIELRELVRAPRVLDARWAEFLRATLESVDSTTYADFLKLFLAPSLALVRGANDHRNLVAATLRPAGLPPFEKAYFPLIKVRKGELRTMHKAALLDWITLDETAGQLNSLRERALDELARGVGAMDARGRSKLFALVEKPGTLNEAARWRWDEFKRSSEASSEGLLSKINPFGRGSKGKP